MALGERIQFYRKANALSQEQVAERVGVSRQAVSKWELNDALPDVDKVVALAKLFQVTTDTLLLEEEAQVRPSTPRRRPQGGRWYLLGLIPLAAGVFLLARGQMGLLSLGVFYTVRSFAAGK